MFNISNIYDELQQYDYALIVINLLKNVNMNNIWINMEYSYKILSCCTYTTSCHIKIIILYYNWLWLLLKIGEIRNLMQL